MRISDWSSDVCSSDLAGAEIPAIVGVGADRIFRGERQAVALDRADCERIGIAAELRIVDRDADRSDEARGRSQRRRDFGAVALRSEEHTSELQSLMRISYAVFCLKKKKTPHINKKER